MLRKLTSSMPEIYRKNLTDHIGGRYLNNSFFCKCNIPFFSGSLCMMCTFTFGSLLRLQHLHFLIERHTMKGRDPTPPRPSKAGIIIGIMLMLSFAISSSVSTHSPALVWLPEHSEQSDPDQSPSHLETQICQT